MGEEKLYFPLLKLGKRQKPTLGRSVSTHFVADCTFKTPQSRNSPSCKNVFIDQQQAFEKNLTYRTIKEIM